jgi:magnesium chelatase family protein
MGLGFPTKRVVVNMAPADIPKVGSHYDLPIALSILGAIGAIDPESMENTIAIGELGLDGNLCHISGAICAAMLANELNYSLICPKSCESEAVWSGNESVIAAPSITSLINHLTGSSQLPPPQASRKSVDMSYGIDIADIRGQTLAKRAVEIAASGGHNVLMIGPPGSGKSMIASRMKTILPELTSFESLETTCIYSIAGMLPPDGLICLPPFREPHHSASIASIVGGGANAKPGEISLAHNGILFLDELPEFQRQVIDSLRQPLETNCITISRAREHVTYPANIQLVSAMNPCKCGFFGEGQKQCSSAPRCATEYRSRISGPILDRFDIIIYVNRIKISEMFETEQKTYSCDIRKNVISARNIQIKRADLQKITGPKLNGKACGEHLESITKLDTDTRIFFQKAVEHSQLSARGCHKLLRVARTIADMELSSFIQKTHIAEAIQYRLIDSM